MTPQSDVLNDERYVPIGEYGFVGLVEVLGYDSTPPNRARTSYGKGTKSVSDDRNLLRYLIRNKHTTPIEMVQLVFHIKLPIFVMRQHVRHRMATINEYSARYSEMSDEFYTPVAEDIALQSTTNKQGREEEEFDLMELNDKIEVQDTMRHSYEASYKAYKALLDKGVARELARTVLPVANYTECYWDINLHNFFHYCNLRRNPHAQKEIRDFADAMFYLVKDKLPIACEAFDDYIFEAVTFSRMEKNLLMAMLRQKWNLQDLIDSYGDIESVMKAYGLTKREWMEFLNKIEGNA